MNISTNRLCDFDYVILALMAVFWSTLFGGLYYLTQNGVLLLIGLIFSCASVMGYLFVGGLQSIAPLEKPDYSASDDRGWAQFHAHDGAK